MATVDGLTKDRMLAIEAESVTGARLDPVTNHLILVKHDLSEIDVGDVQGPAGPAGPAGAPLPGNTVAGPAAFGDAATPGVDDDYSRKDHDHGLPVLPVSVSHSLITGWIIDNNIEAATPIQAMRRNAPTSSDPTVVVMPRAGILTGLSVIEALQAVVGTPMRHYTVYKNGVATAITVNPNSEGTTTTASFVNTGNVAIAAGDQLEVRWNQDAGLGGGFIEVEAAIEVAF